MQLCFTWTETHNSLRPAAGENVAPIQNMHTTTGWSSVDLMPTPVAVAVWFQQPVLVGALPFSLTSLRNVQHDTVVNCCFEVSHQFAKSCHRNQSWLWHVTAQFLYSVHQIRSVTWQVKQCPQNWTKNMSIMRIEKCTEIFCLNSSITWNRLLPGLSKVSFEGFDDPWAACPRNKGQTVFQTFQLSFQKWNLRSHILQLRKTDIVLVFQLLQENIWPIWSITAKHDIVNM